MYTTVKASLFSMVGTRGTNTRAERTEIRKEGYRTGLGTWKRAMS